MQWDMRNRLNASPSSYRSSAAFEQTPVSLNTDAGRAQLSPLVSELPLSHTYQPLV